MTEREKQRARILKFSNALSLDDPAAIGEAIRAELKDSAKDLGSMKAEGIPNDIPTIMRAGGIRDAAKAILEALDGITEVEEDELSEANGTVVV